MIAIMNRGLGIALLISTLALAGCSSPSPEPTASATRPSAGEQVPDVVGMTAVDAIVAIRDAGFVADASWLGEEVFLGDDTLNVERQTPSAGANADAGSRVVLTLAIPPLPEYSVAWRDSLITITVAQSVSEVEARWIVWEVMRDEGQEEGSYFLAINCESGATAAADHRLANARAAVGRRGEALTGGLDDGEQEVELVEGATCP